VEVHRRSNDELQVFILGREGVALVPGHPAGIAAGLRSPLDGRRLQADRAGLKRERAQAQPQRLKLKAQRSRMTLLRGRMRLYHGALNGRAHGNDRFPL